MRPRHTRHLTHLRAGRACRLAGAQMPDALESDKEQPLNRGQSGDGALARPGVRASAALGETCPHGSQNQGAHRIETSAHGCRGVAQASPRHALGNFGADAAHVAHGQHVLKQDLCCVHTAATRCAQHVDDRAK